MWRAVLAGQLQTGRGVAQHHANSVRATDTLYASWQKIIQIQSAHTT
jgi:hypothetical protein